LVNHVSSPSVIVIDSLLCSIKYRVDSESDSRSHREDQIPRPDY
jgi:hypothetical protein